jgi:NAD(P)-dependent dehydrogenase (short-subunit alcohol dehydrogenase family)
VKVFITGGTSGLGLALARAYLGRGSQVAVFGLPGAGDLHLPPHARYEGDVRDRSGVSRAVAEFAPGGLDLMIAGAGINHGYAAADWPDFRREREIIEVNLIGVLNAFEAGLAAMKGRGGGHLVAVASASGFSGVPGNAAYSASKGAVILLCEAFETDLSRHGITVSCIAPGFVATPLTEGNPDSMPFLLGADDAAARIVKAIDRRSSLYVFPWQVRLIAAALKHMPRPLYRSFFRRAYARRMSRLAAG